MDTIILPLIVQVAILFVMLVPGFLIKKCRLAGDGFGKGLSNLVLYIAQPALIVYSYLYCRSTPTLWQNVLWVLLLSLLAHGLFTAVALFFFRRAEDGKRRMLRFMTVFSNAAFMGIPLIDAILGAEATIYASIYNISFNLFLWSLGVYLCTARRDEDGDGIPDGEVKPKPAVSVKKIIFHPVILSSVLGVLCLLFDVGSYLTAVGDGLHPVLSVVIDSLLMLKNLVAPLSMVVVGLRLADVSFRGAFRDKYLYLYLALRHAALPLALLLILFVLSLVGLPLGETVTTVILLLAATPAATSATMFAEKYDCDAVYTSRTVIISTLLSVATMPLIMLLASVLL